MSKLIDADALKKVIDKGIKEPMYQHEEEDWYDGMINAENLIKEQPTIEPQQWIPCSERLPEKVGDYLVTTYNGQIARYIYMDTDSSKEYWVRCVIAWMPLPNPYREDGEQNG